MSEQLKVKGTIKTILAVETGESKAGKSWTKQSFVVDNGSEWNPEVCFSVFGDDKVEMLSKFTQGQEVEVLFNVSSREFNGKYYHNLDAWAINTAKESAPVKQEEESDGLPF